MGLQSRHSQELSKTGKSRSEKKGREYGAERKTGGKDSGLFISVIPQGENPQLDRLPGRDTQSSENTHHCLSLSAPAIGVVGGALLLPQVQADRRGASLLRGGRGQRAQRHVGFMTIPGCSLPWVRWDQQRDKSLLQVPRFCR